MHKRLDFHIRGIAPLIQHNVQLANPRNKYVIEMKKLTAKRAKKTEEDLIELSKLEFLGGLYIGADGGVIVTGESIEAMIGGAARGASVAVGLQRVEGLLALLEQMSIVMLKITSYVMLFAPAAVFAALAATVALT